MPVVIVPPSQKTHPKPVSRCANSAWAPTGSFHFLTKTFMSRMVSSVFKVCGIWQRPVVVEVFFEIK